MDVSLLFFRLRTTHVSRNCFNVTRRDHSFSLSLCSPFCSFTSYRFDLCFIKKEKTDHFFSLHPDVQSLTNPPEILAIVETRVLDHLSLLLAFLSVLRG